MSQTFLPPPIQILSYKAIVINSQASVVTSTSPVAGVFPYINDPLADQDITQGRKLSLKDIPPHIMAVASAEMQKIQHSELNAQLRWFTDDRVYVKEPTFTFGMVQVTDPTFGVLTAPAGTGDHVTGRVYERMHAVYPSPDERDVDMESVELCAGVSNQDHIGLAIPALVNRLNQGITNGYSGSSPTTCGGKIHTDGEYVQCEDGTGTIRCVKEDVGSNNDEGIPGIYGFYAT